MLGLREASGRRRSLVQEGCVGKGGYEGTAVICK